MDDQIHQLTSLESAVLDKMLDKNGERFELLRHQLVCAFVSSRELTGVGFFTNFTIPPEASVRRDLADQVIGGVGADIDGLQHGAGFLLFVRNGVVSCLEGYCYDESWVDTAADSLFATFLVSHDRGSQRPYAILDIIRL